jgi:polyisoprenoid-binding protein YceI
VGFSARHLMVSKVRGSFRVFEGNITIAENPLSSSVEVRIDATSINTRDEARDNHLRSADFFEVEKHQEITFVSTALRQNGNDYILSGDLTIHGVTRPVELALEFNGVNADPWGGLRAGFSAETEINRSDYDITFNMPLDGGGVVVGEKIKITIEIEAVLQKD